MVPVLPPRDPRRHQEICRWRTLSVLQLRTHPLYSEHLPELAQILKIEHEIWL
jgi:hypothetical protein